MNTIGTAVRNIIEAQGHWYDGEVEEALRQLQELLGVETGDAAGLFFSGHDEKWHTYNETNKFSVIQDYINAETGALFVVSQSQEESNKRIELLDLVIDKEKAALEKLLNDKGDSYWGSDEYTEHTVEVCELLRRAWGYDIHETPAWTTYCNKATAPEVCEYIIGQCENKAMSLVKNVF